MDGQSHGSWMKDPAATEANAEKIWVTKEMETNVLYEFANKDDFRRNSGDAKKITLEQRFHVSSCLNKICGIYLLANRQRLNFINRETPTQFSTDPSSTKLRINLG